MNGLFLTCSRIYSVLTPNSSQAIAPTSKYFGT
jgi:hypothetical protein